MAAERDIGTKDIEGIPGDMVIESMVRGALGEDLASLAKGDGVFAVDGVGRCVCLVPATCVM